MAAISDSEPTRPGGMSLWPALALLAFVAVLRLAGNFLYARTYGPLSTAGGDIWFFSGVAKGRFSLFWGDPLQWALPLLRNLPVETIFHTLATLSIALHLLTLWLLVRVFRCIYHDQRAALWASAAYACMPSSFLFCSSSFYHQQAGLPIMLGMMLLAHRWLRTATLKLRAFYGMAGVLLIAVGTAIGPDIWVLLASLVPGLARWRRQAPEASAAHWRTASVCLGGYVFAIIFLGGLLEKGLAPLARSARGIDLAAQRALCAGDLMPFNWHQFLGAYSWVGFALIALIAFAWRHGRFFEVGLCLIPFAFATHAMRFVFLAELGMAFLLCWMFARLPQRPDAESRFACGRIALPPGDDKSRRDPPGSRPALVSLTGGCIVAALLVIAIWRGFTCYCPGSLVSLLSRIRDDPVPRKLTLCNPSYGFLVQVVTGAPTAADMHYLEANSEWMKILTLPADEAVRQLRGRGVTHLLLTSHDYREAWTRLPDGTSGVQSYCSGGLEAHVSRLSIEELQASLLYQAFTKVFQSHPVPGIKLDAIQTDSATRLNMMLYRLD
ncbi:MAG: hypothetical protein HY360_11060 [Verrucomicrobia bacterium]|nr:hypothetical protein [Verrucomicrobiota bacterium]